MTKQRLDVLIAERQYAESRSLAQRLVMAGQVRVNGQVEMRPSVYIDEDSQIEIEKGPQFVSRGGEKLLGALEAFDLLNLKGMVCADVGASTGGFTDCLLQHGAQKVYAIDVGYGILHWKLRNDPRVIVMERTNARAVHELPEAVQLITIDASFISLRIILPIVKKWFSPEGGRVVALIKPQFEAGRKDAARGEGVIRDPAIHQKVIEEIVIFSKQEGYGIEGLARSPLVGPKGNVEFLINLAFPACDHVLDIEDLLIQLTHPGNITHIQAEE